MSEQDEKSENISYQGRFLPYGYRRMAKRLFINHHRLAMSEGDLDLENFCVALFALYDKHGIDTDIEWENPRGKGAKPMSDKKRGKAEGDPFFLKYPYLEIMRQEFANILKQAAAKGDDDFADFCVAVLKVFDEYGVHTNIKWEDPRGT
ncbi:MAG: hypothetical protein MPJ82_06525 [Alphaproteobacteria bacterium]|nr:hypothetical protein [Alphaproteobacteria bacterium]